MKPARSLLVQRLADLSVDRGDGHLNEDSARDAKDIRREVARIEPTAQQQVAHPALAECVQRGLVVELAEFDHDAG